MTKDDAREALAKVLVGIYEFQQLAEADREDAAWNVVDAIVARDENVALVARAAGAEVQREYGIPGKVWSGDGRRYPGDTHQRLVVTLPPTPLESEET